MIIVCAISGVIDLPWNEGIIEQLLSTMHRRGPDQQGVYQEVQTLLLHSRLAIIDPDGGRQPMELEWAGETFVLIYNGELYNTEELRYELKKQGHHFCGHSDTEVVLHAYSQYGASCLDRFNGIFAMAVWEKKRKRLFLARDRIGVKPLFFMKYNRGLLFASEMKTILSYPGIRARLDETGAAQLILLGPGRIPGSGVLKDMQELEPGCYAYYSENDWKQYRYWQLKDREHRDSFEETSECVRYLVEDAIQRQMVSDVPIGTFLSGGLDSSIISAVSGVEMEKRGERLKTFSVDYLNNARYFQSNKFQPEADNKYIASMQAYLKSQHRYTELTTQDLLNVMEEATVARDLPGMADVDFSLLAFCREIRNDVKVALSGECADEIFGGYPWYRDPDIRDREGFPWAQNTDYRISLSAVKSGSNMRDFVSDLYATTCRESDILPGTSPLERRMKELVNLNFRWFMQTLLDRKDRMSMYSALEVRVPFCDYRIAEYLYGVPWEMKDYHGREKGLLRHAVKNLLPTEVLYRKKSPYPKTMDPHYEQMVSQRLQYLMEENSPLWHVVCKEEAKKLIQNDLAWPWYGQLMRRPQIMAYLLQLDFWLKHYNVELCF